MQELAPDTPPRAEGEPQAATPCPECGAALLHTNGCVLCARCGYSPCD